MRRVIRGWLSAILLAFVLLTNTACPIEINPSASGSWEDVDFAYVLLYKGLLLNWLVSEAVPWPSRVRWGVPGNVDFFGFTPNVNAGVFGIDGNFDRRLANSGTDFGFYLRGMTPNRAFADFNRNGSLDAGEATLDFDPNFRQFEFNFPGSNFLKRGGYFVDILPASFDIKSGMDNAIGDVPLDIFTSSGVTHRNLAFLNNTRILPQFAYGNLNGRNLTSQIVAQNPTGLPLVGAVGFFDHGGMPLPVELAGNTSTRHSWTVPPSSSRIWEPSNPAAPVKIGWGIAYGGVEYSVNYGIYKNPSSGNKTTGDGEDPRVLGDLVIEAGISASDVSLRHVINVVKEPGGIDTAFAVVNPTSATANMVLILNDANSERARKALVLAAKNGTARFFADFFGLNLTSFSGTLVIRSDTSVASTSLKTLNGDPSASLPSGNFQIR